MEPPPPQGVYQLYQIQSGSFILKKKKAVGALRQIDLWFRLKCVYAVSKSLHEESACSNLVNVCLEVLGRHEVLGSVFFYFMLTVVIPTKCCPPSLGPVGTWVGFFTIRLTGRRGSGKPGSPTSGKLELAGPYPLPRQPGKPKAKLPPGSKAGECEGIETVTSAKNKKSPVKAHTGPASEKINE